jgi:anti-anti-sigma factor
MLRGELDRQSGAEVRAAVATELIEERSVLIELVGVEFSDVDGVRALADLVKRGRSSGDAGVEVHGARGQVARLIRLLALDDLLISG